MVFNFKFLEMNIHGFHHFEHIKHLEHKHVIRKTLLSRRNLEQHYLNYDETEDALT